MSRKRLKKDIDLRRGVDFIGVTCIFFCHDGKGRLLMHKRSRQCRDEVGRWDCGSGSMEFGETFEKAVRREIKEEYGVLPRNLHFCGVTNVLRKNGSEKTHWIAAIFSAQVDPRKVKIGEPHKMDSLGWFRTDKLPRPLHSVMRRHLEVVRKVGMKI